MGASRSLGFLLACILGLSLAASSEARRLPGQPKAPAHPDEVTPDQIDINDLNLEVAALQVLYRLQLTNAQLEDLARRARDTAQPAPPREAVKVSDKFRRALARLRDALVAGDDDHLDELGKAVEELRDKEDPDLDDAVEIGDEARKQAPAFLRRLSARQVAGYIGDYADQFPDPNERLAEGLSQARKLSGKEWHGLRDEVAGDVGWLVAGLDADAEDKVRKQVTDLLNRAHRLDDTDFKANKADLERKARHITDKVGPTDVHRHFVERALAELLSNPRLRAAVTARLRKKKELGLSLTGPRPPTFPW